MNYSLAGRGGKAAGSDNDKPKKRSRRNRIKANKTGGRTRPKSSY